MYTCSPPSLWKLEDTTGKGVADKRTELVTKFHFIGNAADIHWPFLGPDGRLYWTDGRHGHDIQRDDGTTSKGKGARIFRCRPDGRDLEVVCGGGMDDPVGMAFTPEGEAFATVDIFIAQPRRIDAIIHCIDGGVFPYHPSVLGEFKRTGPLLGPVSDLGWVAPSGLTSYRGPNFGPAYTGNLFSALFNSHAVQRHILERSGATFTAKNEDFLVSTNPDFHPTDVFEDADGSLIVIDTGGWFRIGCPTSQVAKPEVAGAIYRVRRKDAAKVEDPRGLKIAWNQIGRVNLIALLDDPRWAVRDRAINELGKRGSVPALEEVVSSKVSPQLRRNIVWALTRIDTAEARAAVRKALADKDYSVRTAATHSVGLHRDVAATAKLIELVVKDPTPPVRRNAAIALGRIRKPEAVPALFEALRQPNYERFLEHALIYALIEIGDRDRTLPGLTDDDPQVRKGALLALDQMPNGKLTREQVLPLLETNDAGLQQTVLGIVTTKPEWAPHLVDFLRGWLGRADLPETRRETLRGVLLAFAKDTAVQGLVAQTLAGDKTPAVNRLLLLETIAQGPHR